MTVIVQSLWGRLIVPMLLLVALTVAATPLLAAAQPGPPESQSERAVVPGAGGDGNLVLPVLSSVDFRGVNGRSLLMSGLLICGLGLLFGLVAFNQLKNLPVHPSMREVYELIYETSRTY